MATKLTPSVVRRIAARRNEGATYAGLMAEFKLSKGSIANALAQSRAARAESVGEPVAESPDHTPAPGDAGEGDVSIEALRTFLSEQIRNLRRDVANATDSNAKAAANRNLLAASKLLASVAPKQDEPNGFFVTFETMQEHAQR